MNIGMPEMLFILVLALLIFGPKKLPEVGRTIGRGLGEFRKASNDLKRTIEREIDEVDSPPTALPAASVSRGIRPEPVAPAVDVSAIAAPAAATTAEAEPPSPPPTQPS